MLPDLSNRIQNLVKAMETVIAPGISADNSFAKEQAALVIGHLRMLESQWDSAYLYELGSFKNMKALAESLVSLAAGGDASQSASNALNQCLESLPPALPLTATGVNELTTALGQGVDLLIRATYQDGTGEFKTILFNRILGYNKVQSARERVWFKENHLDPDIRDLASMQEMLHSDKYTFSPSQP